MRKPSLLAKACMAKFSCSISATMRSSCSSRATWISWRSSSAPNPRCWYRSVTKTATSASLLPWSLLSRPTPRISCVPELASSRFGNVFHRHHHPVQEAVPAKRILPFTTALPQSEWHPILVCNPAAIPLLLARHALNSLYIRLDDDIIK